MEKTRVADILEEIAELLEVSGENRFKSRTYDVAARALRDLDRDFMGLVREGRLHPDAHDEKGLTDVRFGVATARRGGLEARDALNTVAAGDLDDALRRRAR